MNGKRAEIREKEKRVRELLERNRWSGILLSRQDNFAWFTAGGDSHVAVITETGSASCLVTPGRKFIITTNIEAGRISDEETGKTGFVLRSYPWYREEKLALAGRLAGKGELVSDDGFGGLPNAAGEFARLRYSLLPEEIERYRRLGARAGEAVGRIARAVRPGDTEHRIAGRLAGELQAKGIIPAVILVAADERIDLYRHPIPTEKKVRKRVMIVLCARRWGLIASLTRLVHFGRIGRALAKKHRAVAAVDGEFISRTRPGAKVGEIFQAGVRAYQRAGFAGEWKLHHQGGATGYASRDYKATAGDKRRVLSNQAFAWNPSISGTKSEDTIIAGERETVVITGTPGWPMLPVEVNGKTIRRPDILEL